MRRSTVKTWTLAHNLKEHQIDYVYKCMYGIADYRIVANLSREYYQLKEAIEEAKLFVIPEPRDMPRMRGLVFNDP